MDAVVKFLACDVPLLKTPTRVAGLCIGFRYEKNEKSYAFSAFQCVFVRCPRI